MRIDGSASRAVGHAWRLPERGDLTSPVQAAEGSASSSHAESRELKALRDGVAALPDVRPEVVAEAAARLRSGALGTPEAMARTAEALLEASSRLG